MKTTALRSLLYDQRVVELLAMVGVPYAWGAGNPSTPWPSDSYDCSGFAQGALVYLRLLEPHAPDRASADLARCCERVEEQHARLGDLALYGHPVSHVMVHLGGGWVIGARGGGRNTHGDDPRAFVDLRPLGYRSDLAFIGRFRQTT